MPTKKQARYEELCLQAMEDLNMSPEDFGAFIYDAAVRRSTFDPPEQRERMSYARKKLLTLPYGYELLKLEKDFLGEN